jgi:MerR family mercuric resistance operon transcriptional regulator
MTHPLENATIGALADAAGVNVETIRFYQRKGLVPEPRRPAGSVRRYGNAELSRVRFIKAAQRLGFSLDEIAELLMLEDGTQCDRARKLAEQKLEDVRRKLDDLRRMEATIGTLVRRCRSARGSVRCPLISSLKGNGTR